MNLCKHAHERLCVCVCVHIYARVSVYVSVFVYMCIQGFYLLMYKKRLYFSIKIMVCVHVSMYE